MKGCVAAGCMVVVVIAQVHETAAVSCNIAELVSCVPAIKGGETSTTAECCTKLLEQQPCFCEYIKNPECKPYVEDPGSNKKNGIYLRIYL